VPRADEPRVPVRLSHSDHAAIKAAADSVNVGVAGLMRECAVRYATIVAREIAAGSITLRRQRVEVAEKAAAGQVVRASSLSRDEGDAGWSRQERVNAMTARARAGKPAPKRRAS
jgi:hypothetical protein